MIDPFESPVIHGDCLEILPQLEAESVHAIVTDPPYALGFMRQGWDEVRDYQRWCQKWGIECLRVLKPGGHILAFGGTRTHHRLISGLEDAGLEIRDCLMWLYGSGYPKSFDISKGIDRAAGLERTVVGTQRMKRMASPQRQPGSGYSLRQLQVDYEHTAPASEEAVLWHGWGTALKPAWEPIVLARKSPIGSVASNVLTHSTGGLNINGCRIPVTDRESYQANLPATRGHAENRTRHSGFTMTAGHGSDIGRWPANVVLDEDAADQLDEQTGELTSGANPTRRSSDKFQDVYSSFAGQEACIPARGADKGGASRFFYVAKASRSERGRDNDHPTVKPLELCRWLVRLVTPPSGVVLDPFAGSGTTLLAAVAEGFRYIGIERDPQYITIIHRRLRTVPVPMSLGEEAV